MAMTINYNLTGAQRKTLVTALTEIMGTESKYLGAPTFAYQVGEYHIDKTGTLTGPENRELIATLLNPHKFIPVATEYEIPDEAGIDEAPMITDGQPIEEAQAAEEPALSKDAPEVEEGPTKPNKRDIPRLYTLDTPRGEIYIAEEFATHDEATAEGYSEYFSTAMGTVYSYGDDHTFALNTSHKTGDWDKTTIKRDFRAKADAAVEEPVELKAETDSISITLPLDGFTPENLDNLCKMVTAKEPLIKKALGVDAIPIRVLENGIEFPWFTADHSDNLMAYAQFITALSTTAKEKKRVTAKPQEHFENERFTMRVWLIGLGLIGQEFGQIRKLMCANLSGNSSWRYGAPEKTVEEAAPAPMAIEDIATDIIPDEAGMNSLPEILADAELIHAVNNSFDNEG